MREDLQDPYEYEVDLRDYLNVIWNQKWLIIAIFVVAVVLAGGYSIRQPAVYETNTTLLITPRISEQIVESEEGGLSSISLPEMAYERSALAADLLESIIEDLDLTGGDGNEVSIASLKNRIEINVDMKETSNGSGRSLETPMVTMNVRGQDPEEIKNIANKWAELFQQRTTNLLSSETARSFQFISGRFTEVKEKLKKLNQDRIDYRKNHPIQILQSEVEVLKNRYKEFLSDLEMKKASLEEKRTRFSSLNDVLEEEPRYLTPERSIPSENLWNLLRDEAGTSDAPGSGEANEDLAEFTGLKVEDQEVNEVYSTFNERKFRAQVDIATLEREIDYLSSRLKEIASKINTKQTKIDKAEMELNRLDREINRLDRTYETLSKNLEEARIANEEKESSIRVMEQAVAPNNPMGTNTRQNVAVAGVLGLFIGVLVAFFRNYMEGYEEETEDEGEEEEEKKNQES